MNNYFKIKYINILTRLNIYTCFTNIFEINLISINLDINLHVTDHFLFNTYLIHSLFLNNTRFKLYDTPF